MMRIARMTVGGLLILIGTIVFATIVAAFRPYIFGEGGPLTLVVFIPVMLLIYGYYRLMSMLVDSHRAYIIMTRSSVLASLLIRVIIMFFYIEVMTAGEILIELGAWIVFHFILFTTTLRSND